MFGTIILKCRKKLMESAAVIIPVKMWDVLQVLKNCHPTHRYVMGTH